MFVYVEQCAEARAEEWGYYDVAEMAFQLELDDEVLAKTWFSWPAAPRVEVVEITKHFRGKLYVDLGEGDFEIEDVVILEDTEGEHYVQFPLVDFQLSPRRSILDIRR